MADPRQRRPAVHRHPRILAGTRAFPRQFHPRPPLGAHETPAVDDKHAHIAIWLLARAAAIMHLVTTAAGEFAIRNSQTLRANVASNSWRRRGTHASDVSRIPRASEVYPGVVLASGRTSHLLMSVLPAYCPRDKLHQDGNGFSEWDISLHAQLQILSIERAVTATALLEPVMPGPVETALAIAHLCGARRFAVPISVTADLETQKISHQPLARRRLSPSQRRAAAPILPPANIQAECARVLGLGARHHGDLHAAASYLACHCRACTDYRGWLIDSGSIRRRRASLRAQISRRQSPDDDARRAEFEQASPSQWAPALARVLDGLTWPICDSSSEAIVYHGHISGWVNKASGPDATGRDEGGGWLSVRVQIVRGVGDAYTTTVLSTPIIRVTHGMPSPSLRTEQHSELKYAGILKGTTAARTLRIVSRAAKISHSHRSGFWVLDSEFLPYTFNLNPIPDPDSRPPRSPPDSGLSRPPLRRDSYSEPELQLQLVRPLVCQCWIRYAYRVPRIAYRSTGPGRIYLSLLRRTHSGYLFSLSNVEGGCSIDCP
ncbi:hypothetical protein EVG20_g3347 [Dentipellis fragilis]|uniref:Uncharacterized protein n=1 Tax=Dentipellis fragilis TaxID=205917 RepID=A0A4Y9Z282_9AGAM|nr:hypothetical protein EVG20_g3347 [Dentipellis fragilis]